MAYYDDYWNGYGWAPPFTMSDYWRPEPTYLPVTFRDEYSGAPPVYPGDQPWGVQGGLYPEERAVAAADWRPALFPWQVKQQAPRGLVAGESPGVPDSRMPFVGFGADVPVQALGPKGRSSFAPGMYGGRSPLPWEVDSPGIPGAGPPPPPEGTGESGAGTAPATPPAPPKNPAPAGINQAWWDEFTAEHGGEDPSSFYGKQGEGIVEALYDKEWGDQFAAEHGRPPTQEEWENNWYLTRTGHGRPGGSDDWRETRKKIRAIWGEAMRDATRQRPPTFLPPGTVWR